MTYRLVHAPLCATALLAALALPAAAAFQQRTTQNRFAGTVNNLYRSTDGGATWAKANAGLTSKMVRDLANSGTTLYTANYASVHKSTNNGDAWTSISSGLPDDFILALVVSGTTTLVAGTDNNSIYVSTDDGQSWAPASVVAVCDYHWYRRPQASG